MPRQVLRTLRHPIFTGGVVMASGICSACFLRKRRRCGEATSPSPSAHYVRIHLSQGERPWQRDKVCVDCQGLSLWESCQSRQALTERARTLRDQREQTEGVFPGRQALTRAFPYNAAEPSGSCRAALLCLLERIDREMAIVMFCRARLFQPGTDADDRCSGHTLDGA